MKFAQPLLIRRASLETDDWLIHLRLPGMTIFTRQADGLYQIRVYFEDAATQCAMDLALSPIGTVGVQYRFTFAQAADLIGELLARIAHSVSQNDNVLICWSVAGNAHVKDTLAVLKFEMRSDFSTAFDNFVDQMEIDLD